MAVRQVSPPRPHRTPRPHTAVSLPKAEPFPMPTSSSALPAASPDPFVRARRLWGQLLLKVHHALTQEDC